MRPIIIGVCGSYSGVGKTFIASYLLKNLQGWGAIKYTKTNLYSTIIDDENVLLEEGKDTRRLYDAGAKKVIWVRSPFEELSESLDIAIGSLRDLEGIVIEGNSAVSVAKPDIVIFVFGSDKSKAKDNIEALLKSADIIVYDDEIPINISERVYLFRKGELEGLMNAIGRIINRL
jgi:molybdopterin-guanine dinucleotide biosynthesis protein